MAVTEKATLLQAAEVPDLDAAIITGVATSSLEEPGTFTGAVTPQGSRTFIGALAPPPHWITSDFLHPLSLPAYCLIAGDLVSVSEVEVGSDSENSFEREPNEVHPPPSNFQDVNHKSLMRVAYRDPVPMTRLFSSQLPISEGDQRHLTDLFQGQNIPLDPYPNHENFKRMEGGASSKDYNCLAEGCGIHFTSKEFAHSHIQAVHFLIGVCYPWVRLDGCCSHPDYFQNWEAFRKHLDSVDGAALETSFMRIHEAKWCEYRSG